MYVKMRHALFFLIVLLGTTPVWAGDLFVSAAASLTNAFEEIKKDFESTYPDINVVFNFAASGPLLSQIQQGAPVDVFASADQVTMDKAGELMASSSRKNFAGNALVLIVPADNALKPSSPEELLQDDVQLVAIGNPESVPVGRYTKGALEAANIYEPLSAKFVMAESVRQALDYVARGEVQAGFVYATDAALKKDQVQVTAEITGHTPITYPIAMVAASQHKDEAQVFIDFVLGDKGQAILSEYGFKKP